MIEEWIGEDKDPDYREFHTKVVVDRSKLKEEDTKNKTVEKIETILRDQFQVELDAKEHEISVINGRINDCKVMLDRLRAYVVASYYGSGENVIPTTKAVPRVIKRKPIVVEKFPVDRNPVLIKKPFTEKFPDVKQLISPNNIDLLNGESPAGLCDLLEDATEASVVNRFYVRHKVIVGNVSKYLGNENRKENDKSTHKWMVYVRGPSECPDISTYVKSVWFFLHPSYIPNDIIQIHKPPFQLTRRGWGEFPVRVQLHFKDSRSKRFDIIHHLKLDKTYTGLQTLGAETIVHLELHRHAKDGRLIVSSKSHSSEADDVKIKKPFASSSTNKEQDEILPILGGPQSVRKENGYTSLNGHDSDVRNELDGLSCLSLYNRKKEEQLKSLQLGSSRQSLVSSCVTSASTSRCTSPVTIPKLSSKCFVFDDETDSILRKLVTNARLISPNKKLCYRSFTCPSLQIYKQWGFSKRRASEWQRAAFMKSLFSKYSESDKRFDPPSTKQIMIWCRKNGYTPSERKLKVISETDKFTLCSFCGMIYEPDSIDSSNTWCSYCSSNVMITEMTFNTLTPYETMLNSVRLKEETLKSLSSLDNRVKDESELVDVVSLSNEMRTKQSVDVEILSSKDLDWIYECINELDIHLPTLTITGVKGPFLQAMLLTATKCFLSELLRKSYSNAGERNTTSMDPSMITYYHVFKAIQDTMKFDFLTDTCMGKMEETKPEEAIT